MGRRSRPAVDEKRAGDHIVETVGLQHSKHAVDYEEGSEREGCERRGLKAEARPEHGCKSERFEPQRIDVIGGRRAGAEKHDTQGHEQGEANSSTAPLRVDHDIATAVFLFIFLATRAP